MPWLPHLAASLVLAAGCSRSPSPDPRGSPPDVPASPPRQEAVAAARSEGGGPSPGAGMTPHPDGGSPAVRVRIQPLSRFRVLPVGVAAVGPAGATLDALRARYVGYGFDLGPVVPVPSPPPRSCAELLTRQLSGRGTIFVVPGSLTCSAPFGEVNPVLKAAVVPLGPLGPPGPVAGRRLTALLASVVGEILGLSTPCTDGRTCCSLRKAPGVRALDAWAAVPCPAHASELGRIREAAGLQ